MRRRSPASSRSVFGAAGSRFAALLTERMCCLLRGNAAGASTCAMRFRTAASRGMVAVADCGAGLDCGPMREELEAERAAALAMCKVVTDRKAECKRPALRIFRAQEPERSLERCRIVLEAQVGEHRALSRSHLLPCAQSSVIVTAQVQTTVNDIERKFALDVQLASTRLCDRAFHGDRCGIVAGLPVGEKSVAFDCELLSKRG